MTSTIIAYYRILSNSLASKQSYYLSIVVRQIDSPIAAELKYLREDTRND